jgi:hypothetical protein
MLIHSRQFAGFLIFALLREVQRLIQKTEIVHKIAMENNYYMHDVKKIINALIDIIRNEVAAGKAVRISGLGIFRPAFRRWSSKIYPVVKFSAARTFRDMLRKQHGVKERE